MLFARWSRSIGLAMGCLLVVSTTAHAQSVIAGVVRDTSGAVLPGVTVEVGSPVLIEKVRSAVTDGQGQYRVVDLRPGTYTVTFALPGFATVARPGFELPPNFTASVNAELRVGSLEETVTVTGDSPVVDVQSTTVNQVLSDQLLDSLPTGRSFQAIAQLVVGVTLSQPDVGGSKAHAQIYMSTHGQPGSQNMLAIDGLRVDRNQGDGDNANYFPQDFVQELVFQTSSADAEQPGGGVRVNMVPRDGGNRFSGAAFGNYLPGSWVSNNVTPEVQARGLPQSSKTNFSYDLEGALSGPIMRDRLWFYQSARRFATDNRLAGTYYSDLYGTAVAPTSGRLAVDHQWANVWMTRLTWQVSQRNKIAGFLSGTQKFRSCQCAAGTDPATAASEWRWDLGRHPGNFGSGLKWTSPLTNKVLLEGGYSNTTLDFSTGGLTRYDSGGYPARNTPQWYMSAPKRDLGLSTAWNSTSLSLKTLDHVRQFLATSVSYVTGSHSLKIGWQYDQGAEGPRERNVTITNADLTQQYRLGVPDSVVVTTKQNRFRVHGVNTAFFAQEQWTLRRLTLNGGLRWERFAGDITASTSEEGRFIRAIAFPAIKDVPVWNSWSPRFGAAYDLFGTGKTALKVMVNKYNRQTTTGFVAPYSPLAGGATAATLTWRDLNGDDIAQGELGCTFMTPGCEINLAQIPRNYGVRALNTLDPDIKRPYSIETGLTLQHELLTGVSVSASGYHSVFKDLLFTYNTLRTPSDYTPVSVVSPLDGSVFTVYNVDASKVSAVANLDTTSSLNRQTYNTFELNTSARLPFGINLFGGMAIERTIIKNCDAPDDPNRRLFCDPSDAGIPWPTQFKLSGTYALPLDIQLSGSLQNMQGGLLPGVTTAPGFLTMPNIGRILWSLSPTTRYAAGCPGPCTPGALVVPGMTTASLVVPLTYPRSRYLDRLNLLDLSLSKTFRMGGQRRLLARVDMNNLLNRSSVLSVRSQDRGSLAFNQPAEILPARTYRIVGQFYF